jgi:hypothetical protein
MIQIDDVIISLDVLKNKFCCNLEACKGMCCVEGDSGAPIQEEEKKKLEEVLPIVWNDLSSEAKQVIEKQGTTFIDCEGDLVTSIVNGKDCVFTCYDKKGCCFCAIEKAYREGKTDFYKPISCHLYPIRVSRVGELEALNYNQWDVCKAGSAAWSNREDIPVYRFLKEPIIRKYRKADWYQELEDAVEELKRRKMIFNWKKSPERCFSALF